MAATLGRTNRWDLSVGGVLYLTIEDALFETAVRRLSSASRSA